MLLPKRVQYRRVQRGRMKGKALAATSLPTVNTGSRLRSPAG